MKKKTDQPQSMQLELPFSSSPPRPVAAGAPALRLIRGEGARRPEPLQSRESVVRVLVETGADLLLRRISPERAGAIQRSVDQVLRLFDEVDGTPALLPVLRRELDALEALMTQTRQTKGRRSGG